MANETKARDLRLNTKYEFMKVDKKVVADILSCKSINELLQGQFSGRFTCKQLVTVYCERCYRIARELHLSADECFTEALKIADEKDKELKR